MVRKGLPRALIEETGSNIVEKLLPETGGFRAIKSGQRN
jgi:hypothetical protein